MAQTAVLLEGKRNQVTGTHDTQGRVELKLFA